MCSYNMVDGIYACGHHVGLQQILEHEFGFDGWVVSDWNAAHSVTGLGTQKSYADAATFERFLRAAGF